MKKCWIWAAAVLLICLLPMMAGAESLRGYEKGNGYQYVYAGQYPYEKNGKVQPVLWRILEVEDGKALLLTEYIIDVQQVIFESDPKKIKAYDYRRINSYAESDLYTWLNSTALDQLMGQNPLRNALIDEPGGGKLFVLTTEQFLTTDYGFSANKWNEQKSRQAVGTPYAKSRGLYSDYTIGKSPYWAAEIKDPDGYKLQLVGYNGHLSWGAYTRDNVGLRLSIRLDLSQVKVTSGKGTKNSPYVLTFAGGKAPTTPQPTATAAVTAAATAAPAVTVVPTAVPTNAPTAAPTVAPTAAPTATPTAVPKAAETALLSFVGDCSIGDSIQYADYNSCYHATLDKQGYAWPFSLVKEHLEADDLTIANLEVVFTTRRAHADKMYALMGEPEHVNALKEGSIEMVNTVNNHCMDFFNDGYNDTLSVLKEAGIDSFGTVYPGQKNGHDDLGVKDVNGIRVGFIGFTYPQSSDQKKIANRIKILREEQGCELIVVSLHWGRETHMTPDAGQVTFAKNLIDAGADVIWGHHPHVIQPIHIYKGKVIMYSTGNFTFGTMSKVDPSTGIFQLTYEKVDGQVQLKQLQVIPCETQGNPDYRPFELTDQADREAVFKKLVLKKSYAKCENPPESFLKTGIINFENGVMVP